MMEEGTKQPLPALKWSVPPMSSTAAGRTTATRTPPMQTMAPPMAPPIHPVHPSSIAQPLMPPVRQQNPPPAGYMAAPNKADLPPYPSTSAPPAKPLTSLSQSQSQASRPQQPPLSQNPPPKAPASSSKSSRPTPSNDLLLPTSLLEPMPGAEDLHLVSPSAAALRAISLQSPAHARPRNSPTPGPR